MRILVFGDSIAFGAADPNGGWVQKLGKFLSEKTAADNDSYQVYNLGISADSSTEVLKRFEPETIARERGMERTILLFAFGINDAQLLPSGLRTSHEKFGENVLRLIELARNHSSRIAFVGILPVEEEKLCPYQQNPNVSYKSEFVAKNNEIMREACRKNNIPFVDLYQKFSKMDYKSLLADGLHPNSKGHRKIFSIVKSFLLRKQII